MCAGVREKTRVGVRDERGKTMKTGSLRRPTKAHHGLRGDLLVFWPRTSPPPGDDYFTGLLQGPPERMYVDTEQVLKQIFQKIGLFPWVFRYLVLHFFFLKT